MTKKVNLSCVLCGIILFFLPWVQVSCQEGVAQQSGIQAIRGDVTVFEKGEVQQQQRTDEKSDEFPQQAWLVLGAFVSLCVASDLGAVVEP